MCISKRIDMGSNGGFCVNYAGGTHGCSRSSSMRVLSACEESQVVTLEFRKRGHEAFSCDIQECSGGHPEWHIQGDVLSLLGDNWDMILAFPPCTHLAVSGAAWFEEKRRDGRQRDGVDFFMKFTNVKCERVCIENPVGIMSTIWRKPDQIIQPYEFGHKEKKKTCLWLKNLPKLQPTEHVLREMLGLPKRETERLHYLPPSLDRSKMRSKTFKGVAEAMAEQWDFK